MNVGKGITKGVKLLATNAGPVLTGLSILGVAYVSKVSFDTGVKYQKEGYGEKTYPNIMSEVKDKAKVFAPMIGSNILVMSTMGGSQYFNYKKQAALLSMYTLTNDKFKKYKSKVVETIGKESENKIKEEIHKDEAKKINDTSDTIITTGSGTVLCLDSISGRTFYSDADTIRRGMNEYCRKLLSNNSLDLNDLYFELGLPAIQAGNFLGYTVDDMPEVNFTATVSEQDKPVLVMDLYPEPKMV